MQFKSPRRIFLKTSFLSCAVVLLDGCSSFHVLTLKETIQVVQEDLFPKAKELKINTIDYINIIISHERVTKSEKEFLRNGVKWLNEEAMAQHNTHYINLPQDQRQELLKTIAQYKWGEGWIDTILRYIFEAMLGDPIYGSNNNEAGWDWLNFQGGLPRPTKAYL